MSTIWRKITEIQAGLSGLAGAWSIALLKHPIHAPPSTNFEFYYFIIESLGGGIGVGSIVVLYSVHTALVVSQALFNDVFVSCVHNERYFHLRNKEFHMTEPHNTHFPP